jgi:DNA-binding GntR family transcriptional regulator
MQNVVYCMQTARGYPTPRKYEEALGVAAIETRALSDQVNDLLMEWIANSRLKPGQRLKETELARELGVSRTPIREALKGLTASRFVTAMPRKGVFVSEIDSQSLEEILELRYLLEMYAAERGIERISQNELCEMRSLVEGCGSLVNSNRRVEYNRYVQKDCNLHRLIIKTSGNNLLAELYERLAVFLQIARVRLFESRPAMTKGHEEHKAIVAAYEAGDRDRILQALGSHLSRSKKEILELTRRTVDEVGAESAPMIRVSGSGGK